MAGLGYALSAMCRVGMLAVGRAWTMLAAIVLVDRMGKGIPRRLEMRSSRSVSPEGQLGATTVFVTRHSYSGVAFSTLTNLEGSLATDVCKASLDGSDQPRNFVRQALSPAVVR